VKETKNILITGSNRGIGFETARQLGQKGFHLYLSGRDEKGVSEALEKLKGEGFTADMILMDVSLDDSVIRAAEILSAKNVRFDVIINNAGILLREDRSLHEMDPGILKTTINTNAYGPLRVVRAFLPLMNKPGRIINISSGGGSMSDPVGGWSPAYCASKTLLNAITRHLAYELSGNRISVNAVCPGWVKTDMGGKSAPRSVQHGAETSVWLACEAPQNLTGKFFRDKHEIKW
jgi:NAD(P)-dependent dehydrogenase (short-subunit alcohol dehydrogenase family)